MWGLGEKGGLSVNVVHVVKDVEVDYFIFMFSNVHTEEEFIVVVDCLSGKESVQLSNVLIIRRTVHVREREIVYIDCNAVDRRFLDLVEKGEHVDVLVAIVGI